MVDLDKLEELAGLMVANCPKCAGENWLWAHELDHYDDPGESPYSDQTRYSCDHISHKTAAALTSAKAEIERLKEALRPFADAFDEAREKYSARYGEDWKIGLSNFDKMPDLWSMEKLTFSMGVFRRAAAAMGEEPRT